MKGDYGLPRRKVGSRQDRTWSSLTLSKVDAIRAARSSEYVDNIQKHSIPSSPGHRQLTRDHHIDMAEIFSSG